MSRDNEAKKCVSRKQYPQMQVIISLHFRKILLASLIETLKIKKKQTNRKPSGFLINARVITRESSGELFIRDLCKTAMQQ